MFTIGLAIAESFGDGKCTLLYLGTFLLDLALLDTLPMCFNKKDKTNE